LLIGRAFCLCTFSEISEGHEQVKTCEFFRQVEARLDLIRGADDRLVMLNRITKQHARNEFNVMLFDSLPFADDERKSSKREDMNGIHIRKARVEIRRYLIEANRRLSAPLLDLGDTLFKRQVLEWQVNLMHPLWDAHRADRGLATAFTSHARNPLQFR
jgi:hypothetical protein